MAVLGRLKGFAATAGGLAARGGRRARREADVKRMQAQIVKEQREIGRLVYPLLEDGRISVESPGVHVAVERIRDLSARIEERSGSAPPAAPSGMERDCGWVELLPADRDDAIARGHLFVTLAAAPQPAPGVGLGARGQLDPVESRWRGRVASLRLVQAEALNAGGRYRLRFESNAQTVLVTVSDLDAGDENGGAVSVVSADGELPAMLLEVGGE